MSEAPFGLIIFGVTGNLAQLKLLPALYDLEDKNLLPEDCKILGIGRKELSDDQFLEYVHATLHAENRHHRHDIKSHIWQKLHVRMQYHSGDFNSPETYKHAKNFITKNNFANQIFYVATYPEVYATIFENLKSVGLHKPRSGWTRLMIEKPIGNDLESAKALDKLLNKYFSEEQIFRLDHYLGKETLQNILTFRFGNGIFEPLWNKDYIEQIQVTVAEDFGIGKRGGYFDSVGDLKDMGQNHLLQMLTAVTMESPEEFTNPAVTKERVKVLNSLKPLPDSVVFGQYLGYLEEENVRPESDTDTYFALKTQINNSRFSGVPIYLRSGKKLQQTVAEISIVFKNPQNRLFKHLDCGDEPNALIFRIQPNEGIVMGMLTKIPGYRHQLQKSYMQFCYKHIHSQLPDPYERLIADAISGDQTFFNDTVEIEAQWKFVDPLFQQRARTKLHIYQPGSWGPAEGEELLQKDGLHWLEPTEELCRI